MQAGFGSLARGSSMTGERQTSKRIYTPAEVGSDYFSSFSFTHSTANDDQDVDSRISAISWGHVGASSPAELGKILSSTQVAKSEFYPDPRRGGPRAWSSGSGSLRDSSLLDLRWRARLRRFQPPEAVHRMLLAGVGLASIVQTIKSLKGARPEVLIGVFLGDDPAMLASWAEKAVGTTVSKTTGGLLH